jgi:hypothetical protein
MAEQPGRGPARVDPCARERAEVQRACGDAAAARVAREQAHAAAAEVRRGLAAARAALEAAAAAADNRKRLEEKARLHEAYRAARGLATTAAERQEATAQWARSVDRLNRASRRARGVLATARAQVAALEQEAHQAETAEQAARVRADAAEAACLEARGRLAACEGRAPVARIGEGRRLVVEALVWGDRNILQAVATDISRQTGSQPSPWLARLRQLRDVIVGTAAAQGFVSVDRRHPFWARVSDEEARDILRALNDMGFRIDPAAGWQDGRAPVAGDMAAAIAFAGIDPRTVRNQPVGEELRALPRSVRVDPVALLAAHAPDLALEAMVRLLGEQANEFAELWDAWGQVRPALLAPLGPPVSPAPRP